MKIFEIDKLCYKTNINSVRQREYVFFSFFLLVNLFISIFNELGMLYFIITTFILVLLVIIKIQISLNHFSFCYKVTLNKKNVEFNFIHPFFKYKIVKKYKKDELLVSTIKNHSLITTVFQKDSEIFISNLFEITNNINGWSEKQLKEILFEFK